jgi:threonine/homoserine/homoserine lactone efflux protein
VGSVVLSSPLVLRALNGIGVAYLLWLAWKIAAADTEVRTSDHRPVGFVGAAAFQWINPKSWLVCAGVAGTYLTTQANALTQAATLSVLFFVAAVPCSFVWLAFGAGVQRLLRTPRARRTFNVVMSALLVVSVALILS